MHASKQNGNKFHNLFFFLSKQLKFYTVSYRTTLIQETGSDTCDSGKKRQALCLNMPIAVVGEKQYEMSSMSTIGEKHPTSGRILKCT